MIILASTSARRQDILKRFVDYKIITKDIEENNDDYENPRQLVMALSFEKGIGVALENTEDIVLSADTVVALDGVVMGKPKDREDAYYMLSKLSGKEHEVYSGYSIFKLDEKIKVTNYVKTLVKFKELSEKDINDYLNTNEYRGKAGAYGIQGSGELLVESIIGDFNNVVGLPISRISDEFKSLFNISLLNEVENEKTRGKRA